jgi:predicted nucleic acid-binding Zn finger protein
MSKVKKMKSENLSISKEQLEKVQGLQADLQKYCAHIGGLEVQKAKAIYQINMLEKEMDDFKKSIEDEYGPININLTDGSYEKIVAADKD